LGKRRQRACATFPGIASTSSHGWELLLSDRVSRRTSPALNQGCPTMLIRLSAILLLSAAVSHPYQGSETVRSEGNQVLGQRLFEAHCARCHGLKGTGGTGPGLNRLRLRRAADDQALFSLIKEGAPGTEMPETWQLGDREVRQVAGYV